MNVFVFDYNVFGVISDGEVLIEMVVLNFEEIKWIYDKMGKDGVLMGKFDVLWKVEEGVK